MASPSPSLEELMASPLPPSDERRRILTPEESEVLTAEGDLRDADKECQACRDDLGNQMAHMRPGGCMYESSDAEESPQPWQDDPAPVRFWSEDPATHPTLVAAWTCPPEGSFKEKLGPIAFSFTRKKGQCKVSLSAEMSPPEFEAIIEASRGGQHGVFLRMNRLFEGTILIPWDEDLVYFRIRIAETNPDRSVHFWEDAADIENLGERFDRARADGKEVNSILDAAKRGKWSVDDVFLVREKEPLFVEAVLSSGSVDWAAYERIATRFGDFPNVPGHFVASVLKIASRKRKRRSGI